MIQMKRALVRNNLKRLEKEYPGKKVDVYFFDDNRIFLDDARKQKTSENITLHTIEYRWLTLAPTPLSREKRPYKHVFQNLEDDKELVKKTQIDGQDHCESLNKEGEWYTVSEGDECTKKKM